jgi:type I restriction enzyme S subunit
MELKPGYKLTEVGVIPEDWDVKPLAVIAEKIMVGIASAATHAYRERGVAMFRNQNIKAGYLDDSDMLFIAPEYEVAFRNKRLRSGDLLTARTGYPGVTAVVPPQYDSAQSFTTLITRPKQQESESNYLCHFINSEIGQKFFTQSQIGGAQKNVNAGTLRGMPVPLPKLPEQRSIATALSDMDELLGACERLIAKKRDLKQAAMQQLLTGKTRLPGFGEGKGYQQTEVGEIPEDWNIFVIEELGTVIRGASPRPKGDKRYYGGEVPRLMVEDVTRDGKFVTPSVDFLTEEGARRSRPCPKGTLTLVCSGTVGIPSFLAIDACIHDGFLALIDIKKKVDDDFLYHFLKTQQSRFDNSATHGGVFTNLTTEIFKNFKVPLPTKVEEQRAIATVLSDMDAEIATLEQRRDKTRALKQAMMQELLTGRIRLIDNR